MSDVYAMSGNTPNYSGSRISTRYFVNVTIAKIWLMKITNIQCETEC